MLSQAAENSPPRERDQLSGLPTNQDFPFSGPLVEQPLHRLL